LKDTPLTKPPQEQRQPDDSISVENPKMQESESLSLSPPKSLTANVTEGSISIPQNDTNPIAITLSSSDDDSSFLPSTRISLTYDLTQPDFNEQDTTSSGDGDIHDASVTVCCPFDQLDEVSQGMKRPFNSDSEDSLPGRAKRARLTDKITILPATIQNFTRPPRMKWSLKSALPVDWVDFFYDAVATPSGLRD
jgi:hypothetical protein